MSFWILAGGLALAVSALLLLALRARRAPGAMLPAEYDLRVYRDQLREVDRDLARGVLSPEDAERVRAEVSRRILAADTALSREEAQTTTSGNGWVIGAGVALLLVGGSLGLYAVLGAPGYGDLALEDRKRMAEAFRDDRPSQAEAEASLPPFEMPQEADADYRALVERLRATVAERPDDLQGQLLLARNEAGLGNFAAAARAQAEILRIKGDTAEVRDLTDLADMMVLAAGGYVSPEAEVVLGDALSRDPQNGVARYYSGLMLAQTGRPDMAFRIWERLLREGPGDAPWIPPIRAQIEDLAYRAGVRFSLPAASAEPSAPRGPTQEDMDAAAEMSPQERLQMIEGMVSGLSDRLATEGGPAQDWAQLVTALGVLGRREEAARIYQEAIAVFSGDPSAVDMLRSAGQQAGVAE
ncbi:c-type cytochrome biogenesis protein CcmI [Sulfitobacter sp. D35]|uniref:c-type cytochrome biogenesis protein CcmI n=1 Tax=Sulfitobacter sp. D35 TaxID=3083252 RepID=UPI003990DB31